MKKLFAFFAILFCIGQTSFAQLLSWSPLFPQDADNISITMDASYGNHGLLNYSPVSDVYVHVGVITNLSTSSTDWRYVKFNQNFNQTNAQLQAVSLGSNKWRFDITGIRSYFGVPAGETILRIAILFRSGNGTIKQTNTDGTDMYVPIYTTAPAVRFTVPNYQPKYNLTPEPITKIVGDAISVTANASATASTMKIYFNGSVVQTASNVSTLSASPTITTAGNQQVVAEATIGSITKTDTLNFFVSGSVNIAPLPAGVRDGINYEAGNTSAVLVLNAPGKNRVSVIGEFPGSNWQEQSNFLMNKTPDGNYWWLRVTGLTPGTEYAFQYLVDGTIKVGDPYSEKVLDPWNDGYISPSTYPNLKAYPTGSTTGIVSVLQTNAPVYNWTVPNFNRPDKRSLVVYELLARDFVATHDWKTLRDTLGYLQRLGINAIELMPINEFDGNESWGYNPSFFLAPDKYYGPANNLKEFIDTCHRRGIAVIMDIALNHTTGSNPLAALYWNSATSQPAANNPWLNQTATHPFSVFNDFNHESLSTRYFASRVIEHWVTQYKVDGYRFDLSKGFTQVNSGSNVSQWGQYDASRIAIWKKYYDTLQLKSPGAYAILEHFADNTEEIELSNYGMLLWGNNSFQYEEASMGFLPNSNFTSNLYTSRAWTKPHLVGYMESHDEERLGYKNVQYGNNLGSYNIRTFATAMQRIELNAAFFLTMPGPKMIWQFGELGYDYSINTCPDLTVNNNCRLDKKPIRWDFLSVPERKKVYDVFSKINQLRAHTLYKNNFIFGRISSDLTGGFKWMQVNTDTSNLVVIGNFDVGAAAGSVSFPSTGTWYDYLTGATLNVSSTSQSFTLQPGEYHIYINRNLNSTGGIDPIPAPSEFKASVNPNPVTSTSTLTVSVPFAGKLNVELLNSLGQKIGTLYNSSVTAGVQIIQVQTAFAPLQAGIYYVVANLGAKKVVCKIVVL